MEDASSAWFISFVRAGLFKLNFLNALIIIFFLN